MASLLDAWARPRVRFLQGDVRAVLPTLPAQSFHCCVTSPPYFGLRDYGVDGQIGLEQTPQAYVDELVAVFREVRRVLRDDGTLWLNLGDSYAGSWGNQGRKETRGTQRAVNGPMMQVVDDGRYGSKTSGTGTIREAHLKPKDLIGIPWRVAFALQADGWYLRQDIIWHKPNPMPESVRDRCTKAHEYVFLLSKSPTYYFDVEAIREPAVSVHDRGRSDGATTFEKFGKNSSCGTAVDGKRNRRDVWTVQSQPVAQAHFATFPPALVEPCVLAGCPEGSTVLDPFGGAGTTGLVAQRLKRDATLVELNPAYLELARRRLSEG